MKKKFTTSVIAVLLIVFLPLNIFADIEPLVQKSPSYDLYDFQKIVSGFKKEPFDFSAFTFADECSAEMTNLSNRNFLLLPDFIDIKNLEKDNIAIAITSESANIGSDIIISGTAGKYKFILEEYTGRRKDKVPMPLSKKYYEQKNDIIRTVVDGIEVISYAPGRFPYYDDIIYGDRNCYFEFSYDGNYYILTVSGIEHYDELVDNFGLQIYPLTDGFIRAGGEIYYAYNGDFLSGWYKIGGSRYYFKKDNTAARGVTLIGGKCYMFAEDGKYIGLFSGTAKIGGKTYRFVDGVAKK